MKQITKNFMNLMKTWKTMNEIICIHSVLENLFIILLKQLRRKHRQLNIKESLKTSPNKNFCIQFFYCLIFTHYTHNFTI